MTLVNGHSNFAFLVSLPASRDFSPVSSPKAKPNWLLDA